MKEKTLQVIKENAVELFKNYYNKECMSLQIVINVHPEKNSVQISLTESMKEKSFHAYSIKE